MSMEYMIKTTRTREKTNQLIDLMNDGVLDPKEIVYWCLGYMSEADVAKMVRHYEIDTLQGAYEE